MAARLLAALTLLFLSSVASQETTINLLVASGAQAPPTGTLIDLTTTDGLRGASVSRTIVVN